MCIPLVHSFLNYFFVVRIAFMPVMKVPGGYRWGSTGKIYKTRAGAARQGAAARAAGYTKSNGKRK